MQQVVRITSESQLGLEDLAEGGKVIFQESIVLKKPWKVNKSCEIPVPFQERTVLEGARLP